MKDIKELIYAAVEENAVKFQELVNAQLQVRAYDAIEALRPEVGASMFGEAKKMEDDEEDEDEEMEDEDEMDDKKKSMKEALHPNQQKIDVVDDEKIDAKDFAKLRQMKKMKEEVEQIAELTKEAVNVLMKDKDSTALRYPKGHSPQGDQHRAMAAKAAKTARAAGSLKGSDRSTWKRPGQSVTSGGVSAARPAKPLGEEDVNEVAMPQNQADWQAMINHQIKTTGHPVATDAQFRAPHGKDKTKIASLEPGEDKLQYATAQGGNVKQ